MRMPLRFTSTHHEFQQAGIALELIVQVSAKLVRQSLVSVLGVEIEYDVRPPRHFFVWPPRHSGDLRFPFRQRFPVHGISGHDVARAENVSHTVEVDVETVAEVLEPGVDFFRLRPRVIRENETIVLIRIEHHFPAAT
jgi:hypothetical protein